MLRTCVLLAVCAQMDARTFKAAFFYNGDISDLGWTYTHNEGRIRAQEALLPELEARGDSIHTDIFEALSSEDVKVMMKNVSESGYDMVIGCSFMYHEETFAAAKAHPNVDFVHVSGYYSGQDNFITAFGRVYHSRYVSGVVAGGKSTVKRVGFIASIPIAEVYRSANAYYLGAQVGAGAIMNSTYVEHKVDAVVIWIGTFYDPVKEREAARRLHAMGCDVIAYHTDTQEGALYAKANGIHSVASNTDGRKIIGETVLTSSSFNWGPLYAELMNRSYLGTFKSGSHNLWYGYPAGVSVNHVPSFEVDTPTRKLFHSTVRKMKGGFDPFCHPVWKDGVRVQENVGDCLGDFYLAVKMQFIIDGPTDVGFMSLSGEACGNGTRYTEHVTQNPAAFDIRCHNCAAGTYSVINSHEGAKTCTPCPPGSFSVEGASFCTSCPLGTASEGGLPTCSPCAEGLFSPGGVGVCLQCPAEMTNAGMGNAECLISTAKTYTPEIVLATVAGGLMIIALLFLVRFMRDRSKISSLHSEKAVAMRCAESIACMRLEEVDDIRTIEKPSDIVLSFIRIMDNLIEYRRYLPQTLLQAGLSDSITAPDRIAPGLNSCTAAIVFTDIQRSTDLWEAFPEEMAVGLSVHNRIIRDDIAAHNGYEVKTIGDSFMVAFDTALEALIFSLEIQMNLVRSDDWPQSLHTHTHSKRHGSIWKGLRVRGGLHYGPVTIEENALTRRVDYFGSTVNKAARLEAAGAGGSVCVCEETLEGLQEDVLLLREQYVVVPLPNTTLKGFRDSHSVVLVIPVSLQMRELDVAQCVLDRKRRASSAEGSNGEATSPRRDNKLFSRMMSTTVAKLSIVFQGSPDDVMAASQSTLPRILAGMERTNGNVIAAHNNNLVVGWNTFPSQPVGAHEQLAAHFVSLVQHFLFSNACTAHVGVCTGPVSTGTVGTGNQRFITVVGTPISVAEALVHEAEYFECFACVTALEQKLSLCDDPRLQDNLRPVSRVEVTVYHEVLLPVYEMDFMKNEDADTWLWGPDYEACFDNAEYKPIEQHCHRTASRTPLIVSQYLRQHGCGARVSVKD